MSDSKESILKDTLLFLIKYDKKITEIVNSLTITYLNLSPLKIIEACAGEFDNNDINLSQMEKISRAKFWGKNECKI